MVADSRQIQARSANNPQLTTMSLGNSGGIGAGKWQATALPTSESDNDLPSGIGNAEKSGNLIIAGRVVPGSIFGAVHPRFPHREMGPLTSLWQVMAVRGL